ncbi:PsbP domain-containing protein 6, chloroplastic, partial [Cucurbita argyrosperma subsp. sororia]
MCNHTKPWVEVKFEEDKQGKIQVVASPLIRLTNKPNATIEDIGSPDKVIASLGPFVTGNTFHPEELVESSVEKLGDHTYYKYTLETPYALTGTHNLTKATAKGSTVVLFVARTSRFVIIHASIISKGCIANNVRDYENDQDNDINNRDLSPALLDAG